MKKFIYHNEDMTRTARPLIVGFWSSESFCNVLTANTVMSG